MATTLDMTRDDVAPSASSNRDLIMSNANGRERRYYTSVGGSGAYNSVFDDCLRAISLGYCFGLGFSILNR